MLIFETNILFALCTSFLITYFAVPKVIDFSKRFRLSDVAGKRAAHSGSVPVLGGVAIFAGILFSLIIWGDMDNFQFIIARKE